MTIAVALATTFAVAVWLGYVVGHRQGVEWAESEAERLLRIEPLSRTEGLPTNLGVEPSRAARPKFRQGRFMQGPDQ